MKYKKYIATVEYDDEVEIFHGEVINIKDVITFQGTSVQDIKQAFVDSVEDYLEWCAERDEQPEKPFSGKFVLRLDPEMHRELSIKAKKQKISLNSLINEKLQEGLG